MSSLSRRPEMTENTVCVEILMVEDNPADVPLLAECLQEVSVRYQLSIVSDGEAALAFLARQEPYTTAPRPTLILLDISLPRISGWEVLAWLRVTPALSRIPVVIVSSFFTQLDEAQAARWRPTLCLAKPRGMGQCERVGQAIKQILRQTNLSSRGYTTE